MDADGVFDRIDHCVNTKPGCVVDRHGCETDADGDGVCDGRDHCQDTPAGTRVDGSGCPEGAATEGTPAPAESPAPPAGGLEKQLLETGRIRLENVYFETNSARLLAESEVSLREAGETLEKFPQLEIEIQGHTDTRGSAQHNLRLSQARAEAVRDFLIEHFQLERRHFTPRGYGEAEPETRERNEEELLRNRRVELHVLNPGALPRRVKLEKKD
jgi:outer membrane protein OmpA-like peptidoglycan-associated protein